MAGPVPCAIGGVSILIFFLTILIIFLAGLTTGWWAVYLFGFGIFTLIVGYLTLRYFCFYVREPGEKLNSWISRWMNLQNKKASQADTEKLMGEIKTEYEALMKSMRAEFEKDFPKY